MNGSILFLMQVKMMSSVSKFCEVTSFRSKAHNLNETVFICAKGAEDRSYVVFEEHLDIISPKRIILLDPRAKYETASSEDVEKYDRIESIIAEKGVEEISIVSLENSSVGLSIHEENITENDSVAIDISSMSFWEYSDLIYYLLKIAMVKKVDIFYTEPGVYHYENDNIAMYTHHTPQVAVKYVNSYYSTRTTEEEVLVSMIGFQKHVNKLMKDSFEVSDYYSINGFPSFYPKAKDISQTINSDFLSEIVTANKFSTEAKNPFFCYNTLLEISHAAKGAFMNICPLSSKPMAVGACLYVLKHPDTARLVYPFEESVFTKADGVGNTYCFTITQDFLSLNS